MKYFSEVLNKLFDTEEQLKTAENEKVSRREKAIGLVKECEENLNKANADYEKAFAEAKNVSDTATKRINELLTPAEKNVTDATSKFNDAVTAYNAIYGKYKDVKVYTDKEATKQFSDLVNMLFE